MILNYDTLKINSAIKDFYNATGIDIDLLKADFSQVNSPNMSNNCYCRYIQSSAEGMEACRKSDSRLLEKCKKDKKISTDICHAGLTNLAIPILNNDIIIGYIITGRMKPDNDFSALKKHIQNLEYDVAKAREYYNGIPFYDAEKIQSISNIATMFVKYILLENMFNPDFNEAIEKAVYYINNNLHNNLSIKAIATNINVSKSVLYEKFHKHFNCTVNDYVKGQRVKKSVELLEKTALSIEEISQLVGFSSASYYSKTFKKYTGMTPLKFRKKSRIS